MYAAPCIRRGGGVWMQASVAAKADKTFADNGHKNPAYTRHFYVWKSCEGEKQFSVDAD